MASRCIILSARKQKFGPQHVVSKLIVYNAAGLKEDDHETIRNTTMKTNFLNKHLKVNKCNKYNEDDN